MERPMSSHATGIICKEMVRRAMVTIQNERKTFEVAAKKGYGGEMDDVLTSADRAAQEIYLRSIQECFPWCGIVAEEDGAQHLHPNAAGPYDPLDGTKAFVRRQTHGVATMLALVEDHTVISAYIGDVNSGVVYGFRPSSEKVHRITHLDIAEELTYHSPFKRGESYVLLREPLNQYGRASRKLVPNNFSSYLIDGGSIGVWFARLWKREVHALLLRPGHETPWDSAPVIGISQKLGYAFLRPAGTFRVSGWKRYTPKVTQETYFREHDTLIMHEKDLSALEL